MEYDFGRIRSVIVDVATALVISLLNKEIE
jgi:hypothetical protein